MSKFIITGTGRSGTTYCQAILKICGINATHQGINFENGEDYEFGDTDGDVSFMAVPFLPLIKKQHPDIEIVWVAREREAVINSMVERMWFEYPISSGIMHWVSPADNWANTTARERAEDFYEHWQTIASWIEHDTFKLVDNPKQLFEMIGHGDKYDDNLVRMIRKDTNSLRQLYD